MGLASLFNNTIGRYNAAIGFQTLESNKSGYGATAIGYQAMRYANNTSSTFANYNIALGYQALRASIIPTNNTGNYNVTIGRGSMYNNTSGSRNAAIGSKVLNKNTSGDDNTALGNESLVKNTMGNKNSGVGALSLINITGGSQNSAIGYSAFSLGNYTNSAGFGYDAEPQDNNKIMIGNSSVTWIGGYSSWNNISDARVKNDVQENVIGLEFINKLRPVTYFMDKDKIDQLVGTKDDSKYEEKYDINKINRSGFIAQEVERAAIDADYIFSGVSAPNEDTKYYSLSYSEFVVPLVKSVQELAEKIKDQQTIIEALLKQNDSALQSKKELKSRLIKLEFMMRTSTN